jgi:hypothetical protein
MLTTAFWIGMFDRAVKSFCQALLLLWGGDQLLNMLEINVGAAFGYAAMAAVLSILTSFVSAPVGESGTTSFLPGGH